jgi:two-component system LytT family response regulator
MKAIVVEDSRLAREGLVRMLGAFASIELLGQAGDLASALDLARAVRPELVLLDIHLPGGTGFELLEQLDYEPRVIFTTAYSEHAIRSFDHHTVDYLLKPISPERLAQALAKLSAPAPAVPAQMPLDMDSRIFIKDGERCHLVSLTSIRCVESCKNYALVHFEGGKAYVKKSLNAVEERLPRSHFFRVNRQLLVSLRAISRLEEPVNEGLVLTLVDGQRAEVSRRQARELKELLSL